MPLDPTTPGVYINEIDAFPPSVPAASTSVPMFFGYTATQPSPNVPMRITSMNDYQTYFGLAPTVGITITMNDANTAVQSASINAGKWARMYYAIQHYFANGGGPCYVCSVDLDSNIGTSPKAKKFTDAMALLENYDEPSLIVFTDAIVLSDTEYTKVIQQALLLCGEQKNRFTIADCKSTDYAGTFRDMVNQNQSYMAAYTPMLNTSLSLQYEPSNVTIDGTAYSGSNNLTGVAQIGGNDALTFTAYGSSALTVGLSVAQATTSPFLLSFSINSGNLTIAYTPGSTKATVADLVAAFPKGLDGFGVSAVAGQESTQLPATTNTSFASLSGSNPKSVTLDFLHDPALNSAVRAAIASMPLPMPPSAAVAGVYANVDTSSGVWHAPANVALASVIGPSENISDQMQGGLNVDPIAGKSINAIRTFQGRGTVIWGARTLDGNDLNWRYINVRRLFMMMETSLKSATRFAVFMPNDENTWATVREMCSNFLTTLWQEGALVGPTAKDAFFVHCGLGTTMTADDIRNGYMNVTIGAAPSRPAEFIILNFTQIIQTA